MTWKNIIPKGRRKLKASEVPEYAIAVHPDGRVEMFGKTLEGVDGSAVFNELADDKTQPWWVPYVLAYNEPSASPGFDWHFTPVFSGHTQLRLFPTRYGGRCYVNDKRVSPRDWWRLFEFHTLSEHGWTGRMKTATRKTQNDVAMKPMNGGGMKL